MSDQQSQAMAAVCERFSVPPMPPMPTEKLGIAIASLNQFPWNALRHTPENGTCGWYIWGGEELSTANDFFQPMHVAHLNQYLPEMVEYLGLPPGWRVLLAPNYEDVWFDANLLHQ